MDAKLSIGGILSPLWTSKSRRLELKTPSHKSSMARTVPTRRPTWRSKGHTTSHSGRLLQRRATINLRQGVENADVTKRRPQGEPHLELQRKQRSYLQTARNEDPAVQGFVLFLPRYISMRKAWTRKRCSKSRFHPHQLHPLPNL